MGNINRHHNGEQIKYEIKQLVSDIHKVENKINKANKLLLMSLQRHLKPSCFMIEGKSITIFQLYSYSSFFDKDELQYCVKQVIQQYKIQIKEYLEELNFFVQSGMYYIKNCSVYQNNIEFLILKQYINMYHQNEFQFQIIDKSQECYESPYLFSKSQSFEDF